MANVPTSIAIGGQISRAKPQGQGDGNFGSFRQGRYSEEYNLNLVPKSHLLADEGSYFVAANPVSGTGVANQAAPTGVPAVGATDTKPFLVVQNTSVPGAANAVRTYFDYVRFRVTAAGTNGTAINFTTVLDVANAPRAPASYATTIVPTNCNMDDGTAPVSRVYSGAGTVTTTSTGRLFPNIQLRPVIPVVGDIYIVSFGPQEFGVGSLISSGTGVCQQSFGHPPIIIGPGQWALFYLWLPSQTVAGAFEFDLGLWER